MYYAGKTLSVVGKTKSGIAPAAYRFGKAKILKNKKSGYAGNRRSNALFVQNGLLCPPTDAAIIIYAPTAIRYQKNSDTYFSSYRK